MEVKVVVVWCSCSWALLMVAIWLLWASFENEGEAMFAGWSCGGKEAKVVVFELWLFGDDVGGGDLVFGGWLVQNNDRKKKNGYLKASQPGEHE